MDTGGQSVVLPASTISSLSLSLWVSYVRSINPHDSDPTTTPDIRSRF